MNLKLLEKLVRLANNNPNENEANLAARRACKLIEDGKFKYVGDTIRIIPQDLKVDPPPPTTWNDVTRSEESFWSSKSPNQPSNAFYEFIKSNPQFKDLFDSIYGGSRGGGKSEWNKNPFTDRGGRSPFEPSSRQKSWFDEQPNSSSNWDKESAPIKICERCKKEYKSPRIINVCAECQWKEAYENVNKDW